MRSSLTFSSVLIWILLSGVALARQPATTAPTTQPAAPLGIALEGVDYPYPVHYLDLTIDGQPVRMAYMDVSPQPNDKHSGTVVLLHGKNFWGAYWRDTIKYLSDEGYRVIVPDQIGFGKSSKPDIHYSFDLLADNTLKLMDELKVDRFTVVGHSMGGMLAVRLTNDAPDRVERLILENPIGLEDYRLAGVPARSLEQVFHDELNKSPRAMRDYIKTYFPKDAWREEWSLYGDVPARIRDSGEWPRWAMASALTYQMIYQQPVRQEFSKIRVRTLLIIGQADRTAVGKNLASEDDAAAMGNYPELGRKAQQDIRGADLIELEGVGHIPHLQSPQRFHEAVLRFLEEGN